ncbi:choice-of-anchor G family protein [Curtobacterium flaccumfaciens]|nr:choice-of-anchor G family protein [Curtobacterium flaccumfaciens]
MLGAGGSILAAESASAAPVVSTADGRFLSGTALGINLDNILTVEPADATNTGGAAVTDVHPLNVTALNAVNVDIGSGLNLLGDNGILTLGAVNQYAAANPDGSSAAASGAVTNTGGIGVGGADGVSQSNATLDLSGLIGADLADSIADVQLSTGALSATATQAAGTNGTQDGDYQIAGLTLNLTSPALADTVAGLGTTLDGLQPTVNGVVDTLNGLGLGVVTVTGLPNLSDTLDSVTDVTSADGSITANLQTGAISVDVAAVLASQGLDLNNLPANTELLPYITRALTTQLLPALTQALTGVASQITSSLQNVTATVAGIPIPAGTLLGVVTPVIDQVVAPINTAATGLGETVVTPLATALTTVLSVQANRQETAGGIFTERALRIGLLPTAATPAAIVNLASASVGPNAGPAAALPTITGIDPITARQPVGPVSR